MNMLYDSISEYINSLTIIDTHEHLPPCESARNGGVDILGEYLSHYMSSDLISAGLSAAALESAKDAARPILERWDELSPYWEACRHTGYARCLDATVKLVYGEDGINRSTIERLNAAFLDARARGGVYSRVLKQIGKIEQSILDLYYFDCVKGDLPDVDYMVPALNIHALVYPDSTQTLELLKRDTGIKITSFCTYCEAVRATIRKHATAKLLKCALAYQRRLYFGAPDRAEAIREFDEAMDRAAQNASAEYAPFSPGSAFQDSIMHEILRVADEANMTFQFHTGLQEGNGNDINNSDPSLLTNLIFMYKNVTFDLFHISYPFAGKAAVMAKNFPNVTLDMCWAHIMSPRACVTTLLEWLELVPYTKISGFGGDYAFIDAVAGHQQMARDNISRALTIACEQGDMTVNQAKAVGKALLYDNPKRIFKLAD